jgi:hypothetical protein
MVRATDWDGLSCGPSTAVVGGDLELVVLTPFALVQQAPETPGTVARVFLPTRTRIVRIYTSDEAIRVALDEDPLLEAFSAATSTGALLFALGDTVLPGAWHAVLVPLDSLTHVLHVTSTGTAAPRVRLVALVAP